MTRGCSRHQRSFRHHSTSLAANADGPLPAAIGRLGGGHGADGPRRIGGPYKAVHRQQICRRWPLGWIPLQTTTDEILSICRDLRRHRWCVVAHADHADRVHLVVKRMLAPGILGRGHLDHRASERPNVLSAAMAYILPNFWSGPRQRAHCGEGLRLITLFGAAKIRKLDVVRALHEDVGSFQVSVNDTGSVRMQVLEALEQAAGGLLERARRQWAKLRQP